MYTYIFIYLFTLVSKHRGKNSSWRCIPLFGLWVPPLFSIHQMVNSNVQTPPGLTVVTFLCVFFFDDPKSVSHTLTTSMQNGENIFA